MESNDPLVPRAYDPEELTDNSFATRDEFNPLKFAKPSFDAAVERFKSAGVTEVDKEDPALFNAYKRSVDYFADMGLAGLELTDAAFKAAIGTVAEAIPGQTDQDEQRFERDVYSIPESFMGYSPSRIDEAAKTVGQGFSQVGKNVLYSRGDLGTLNMFLGDLADNPYNFPKTVGADGKTRYEISDAQSDGVALIPSNLSAKITKDGQVGSNTVSDILVHNELYRQYPEIADIPIVIDETLDKYTRGYFSPVSGKIGINPNVASDPAELKQTLTHEIQHWIQDLEEFDTGTNLRSLEVSKQNPTTKRRLIEKREEMSSLYKNAQAAWLRSDKHNENAQDIINFIFDEIESQGFSVDEVMESFSRGESLSYKIPFDLAYSLEALVESDREVLDFISSGWSPKVKFYSSYYTTPIDNLNTHITSGVRSLARYFEDNPETFTEKFKITPKEFQKLDYKEENQYLKNLGLLYEQPRKPRALFGRIEPTQLEVSDESYRTRSGEVEARNTGQRRLEMSQESRKLSSPEDTEDRPRSEQWQRDFNKGGMVEMQEGGMTDSGAEIDPVSGNEVPPGSLPEEVRDQVDAKLSPGEYVVPADVLQYYGMKFFEDLRAQAKADLQRMDQEGRIGGEPEVEGTELTPDEMAMLQEVMQQGVPTERNFNDGGLVGQGTFNPANWQAVGFGGGQGNVSGVTEYKTYVGPGGEIQLILFKNGQPVTPIPAGFKEQTEATPEQPVETKKKDDDDNQPQVLGQDMDVTNRWLDANYEALNNDPVQVGLDALENNKLEELAGGNVGKALGIAAGPVGAGLLTGFNTITELNNLAQARASRDIAASKGLDTSELDQRINKAEEGLSRIGGLFEGMGAAQGTNILESFNQRQGSTTTTAPTPSPTPTTTSAPRPKKDDRESFAEKMRREQQEKQEQNTQDIKTEAASIQQTAKEQGTTVHEQTAPGTNYQAVDEAKPDYNDPRRGMFNRGGLVQKRRRGRSYKKKNKKGLASKQ